jgi:hypothetical protein
MSLNKTEIDAYIDRRLGLKSPHNLISYSLADRTADENLALDYILAKIFQVGGRWQFDDSNHTDYPIIMTDLKAGQRDYSFTTDEQGNLILDIYKVMVTNDGGISYDEVYPVDMRADEGTNNLWDNKDVQGSIFRYSKTANGIFLDQLPSADVTNGLKVFINREGSHFTTADTTKKPGFAGSYHEYIGLRPAYRYATDHSMANAEVLKRDMMEMEEAIKKHYRDRSKDEDLVLQAADINYI